MAMTDRSRTTVISEQPENLTKFRLCSAKYQKNWTLDRVSNDERTTIENSDLELLAFGQSQTDSSKWTATWFKSSKDGSSSASKREGERDDQQDPT